MRRRSFWPRRGRWLSLASLVAALGGSAFALLAPTGRYEEAEAVSEAPPSAEGAIETGSTTLLGQIRSGEEDAFVLVWLAVPVALAFAAVALAPTRFDVGARAVAAALLLAFAFVTGFSIGLFYVPAALAMVAAAVVGRSSR